MARKSKKGGNSPLDLAMAALAAGSVAFVVYVMPNASFTRAVELSGLPLILPAANPPLGETARVAAAAFGAIGVFVLVALILRALGKSAARPQPKPQRRSEPVEIEVPLPKIRRADAHPDAPARRPIFAGLDLGEPFDAATFEQDSKAEDDLAPAEDEFLLSEEDLHYPVAEEGDQEIASFDSLNYPAVEAEEAAEDWPLPSFIVPQEEAAGAEPAAPPPPPPMPEPADGGQDSIPHLMQRLELGLVRRQDRSPDAAAPFAPLDGSEEPNPAGHRLRSAIQDLQKLAARG